MAALARIERLIDGLCLDGREQVLEVHAGSALIHERVAHKLTTGRLVRRVVSGADQGSASNPAALGVAPGGDLPFDNGWFDLVITRLALHCVEDQVARARLLREMARVLKPGGRIVLIDCCHAQQYVSVLSAAGLRRVQRRRESFLAQPRLDVVTARKPIVVGLDEGGEL